MSPPPGAPEGIVAVQVFKNTTFYICLEDNNVLNEVEYNNGWSNPIHVGYAKPDTTVAYTVSEDNRTVFCLDNANYLQDYQFNAEEGEWMPGQLSLLKIAAHPSSRIAVDGKRLYFQTPSVWLQEVLVGEDGLWKLSEPLPAKPVVGTSLAAIAVPDGAYAFYTHQDNSIHQAAFRNGGWTDTLLGGDDGSEKTSIRVISSEHEFGVRYQNAMGECFDCQSGRSEKIGDIVDGKFRPINNAQAFQIGFFMGGWWGPDPSDDNKIARRAWSTAAPAWRIATPGLSLEGHCRNSACGAYNQGYVLAQWGYRNGGVFDLFANYNDVKCPNCQSSIQTENFGFQNTQYKVIGQKKNNAGFIDSVNTNWTWASPNYYTTFLNDPGSLGHWGQLRIEVKAT